MFTTNLNNKPTIHFLQIIIQTSTTHIKDNENQIDIIGIQNQLRIISDRDLMCFSKLKVILF